MNVIAKDAEQSVFGELKSALSQTAVWGLGAIAAKAMTFLMLPYYTTYLKPADMGILEISELSMSLLGMFLQMGIGAGILRHYQQDSAPYARKALLSSAWWFTFAVGGLLGIVGFLLAPRASAVLIGKDVPWIYLYLSFVQFILGYIGSIPYSYLRARHATQRLVVSDVASALALILLSIYTVSVLKLSLFGVLISAPLINFVKVGILLYWVREDLGFTYDRQKLRDLLAFGSPLIVANIAFFVLNFSDRFFLQRFVSLDAVGLYSVAYKFGFILNLLLIQPFNMMWQVRMYVVHRHSEHKRIFHHILMLYVGILTAAALGISLFSKDIVSLMARSSFSTGSSIVPIIAAGYLFLGIGQYLQTGMYLSGRTGKIAHLSAVVAVLNLVLNYFLIPRLGIMGAACATAIGFFSLCVGSYIGSESALSLGIELRRLLLVVGVGAALFLVYISMPLGSLIWGLAIKLALFCSYPVLLRITGAISAKDMELIWEIMAYFGFQGRRESRAVSLLSLR